MNAKMLSASGPVTVPFNIFLQNSTRFAQKPWARSPPDEMPITSVLTMFENLAYCMAYAAHPDTTPESAEAWLDTLPALPIMSVFPQIELLWLQNLAQLETPAKK